MRVQSRGGARSRCGRGPVELSAAPVELRAGHLRLALREAGGLCHTARGARGRGRLTLGVPGRLTWRRGLV